MLGIWSMAASIPDCEGSAAPRMSLTLRARLPRCSGVSTGSSRRPGPSIRKPRSAASHGRNPNRALLLAPDRAASQRKTGPLRPGDRFRLELRTRTVRRTAYYVDHPATR